MIQRMKNDISFIDTLLSVKLGLQSQYSEAKSKADNIAIDIEMIDEVIQASREGGKIMSVVKDMYGLTVEWCDKCGKYTLFQNDVCMGAHDDTTGTV